jgi:hypothetical protein
MGASIQPFVFVRCELLALVVEGDQKTLLLDRQSFEDNQGD